MLVALERPSSYPIQPFVAETVRGYPWTTYKLVAMSDPSDLFGTAFPTLGFVGDSSLVLVPHETAHQWFYSLVGNQARDPWLNEGLRTASPRDLLAALTTFFPDAEAKLTAYGARF